MDEKLTALHKYLSYCDKSGINTFSILNANLWPDPILLAWFLPQLAYLNMLFILAMACTAGSAGHLKDK